MNYESNERVKCYLLRIEEIHKCANQNKENFQQENGHDLKPIVQLVIIMVTL